MSVDSKIATAEGNSTFHQFYITRYLNNQIPLDRPPLADISQLAESIENVSSFIAGELRALLSFIASLPEGVKMNNVGLNALLASLAWQFNELGPNPDPVELKLLEDAYFNPPEATKADKERWAKYHSTLRDRQALEIAEKIKTSTKPQLIFANSPMFAAKTYLVEKIHFFLDGNGTHVRPTIVKGFVSAGGVSRLSPDSNYSPDAFPTNGHHQEDINELIYLKRQGNNVVFILDEVTFSSLSEIEFIDMVNQLASEGIHMVFVGLGGNYLDQPLPIASTLKNLLAVPPDNLEVSSIDCQSFNGFSDPGNPEPDADTTARHLWYKDEAGDTHYIPDIAFLPLKVPDGSTKAAGYIPMQHQLHVMNTVSHFPAIQEAVIESAPFEGTADQYRLLNHLRLQFGEMPQPIPVDEQGHLIAEG